MKKTLRVGIASYEEMKARTIAIAKGERTVGKNDPEIWFLSLESMAKILSAKNRALLEIIAEEKLSLTDLAARTGRNKSNLSRTLKTMAQVGLVDLKRENGKLMSNVPYTAISLNLPI
jgi:predicted transcriptional regulator